MRNFWKKIIAARIFILAVIGGALYSALSIWHISLWYVLFAGVITGMIFGKVFCRWICPVGLLMEMIMRFAAGDKFRQMYQYHKLGCPIAWIAGLLNRFSLFKIRLDEESCTSCGICDKKCYIVSMEKNRFSLHEKSKLDPGINYSCSKCLECVAACPNGSLKYKF
jgi:polyferredoxin